MHFTELRLWLRAQLLCRAFDADAIHQFISGTSAAKVTELELKLITGNLQDMLVIVNHIILQMANNE